LDSDERRDLRDQRKVRVREKVAVQKFNHVLSDFDRRRPEQKVTSSTQLITGPPNGPVLFSWLSSVIVCRRRL